MSLKDINTLTATPDSHGIIIKSKTDFWDFLLRSSIITGLMVIIYLSATGHVFQPLFRALESQHWLRSIERPSMLWALMGILLLAFRTLLWFRYKPFTSADSTTAPSITVIIPAYNEGPMVEKSIDSVAMAHYPHDRLEILVIDDGSTDNTWTYIERAAKRYPELVTTVRFSKNQGKRAGLENGFRRARGEIVITIDSDSIIEQGTLLAMAGPFRDAKVGAVAGRVSVYNRKKGLIPRMLHVRYTLSFDFLRAVQSTYNTVYCCPGALAAYRTSVVREVLDEWVNQTFLGAPCTYGEDRSMTNYILLQGYDTVYQRTAVVHTVVPETYTNLTKMFLRWDRSYVREEIRFFANVVWNRPMLPRIIAVIDQVITNLRFPVGYATIRFLFLGKGRAAMVSIGM